MLNLNTFQDGSHATNDMASSTPYILRQKKNSNSYIKTIPSHYALLPAFQPHFQLSESEKKAISLELNIFSFIFVAW